MRIIYAQGRDVYVARDVIQKKGKSQKETPPLGIEPRTCRLTADRSANGALEAWVSDPDKSFFGNVLTR